MSIQATFTPEPGVFGDLLAVTIVYDEGGADLVITIADGTGITLTIGTTGGVANLQWDQIATMFNADPAGAIASMVGAAEKIVPFFSTVDNGGAAGLGLGQFYAAGSAPPPPAP